MTLTRSRTFAQKNFRALVSQRVCEIDTAVSQIDRDPHSCRVHPDVQLHATALIGKKFNNSIEGMPFWEMTIWCEDNLRIAPKCSFVTLTSFCRPSTIFRVLVAASFHSRPEATS